MYIRLRHKIHENVNQAKAILKKKNIPLSEPDFLKLRKLLKGKEGYLGWFTKMKFENEMKDQDIESLISIIEREPEVIKALPDQLISYKEIEELIDDIIGTRQKIWAKRFWNEFPSHQKKILPFEGIEDDDIYTLFQMYKNKEKGNFIKKISRYKTKEKLVKAMQNFYQGKTAKGFENVMKQVEASGAEIIHSSKDDDIIITRVTYDQCNSLGSDTSWCLIGSKGTFKDYTSGSNDQYIIFLTDEVGNHSKIGVTYGFNYRTAHLKDDTHVVERGLNHILKERNVDPKIMEADREEFKNSDKFLQQDISDLIRWNFSEEDIENFKERFIATGKMKTMNIGKLQDIGFTDKEIVDNRGILTKSELSYFSDRFINDHGLRDKTIIDRDDIADDYNFFRSGNPQSGIEWVKKNKHRFNFKLNVNDILENHPVPRDLDEMPRDAFDYGAKKWLSDLDKYKGDKEAILKNAMNFYNYEWEQVKVDWKGNVSKKDIQEESLDAVKYALKYLGFHDGNFTDEEAMSINVGGGVYDLIDWLNFLETSGFKSIKDNYEHLSKVAPNFISTRWGKKGEVSDWFKLLKEFPILKPKVREAIEQKGWGAPDYFEGTLKDIKREFPDLYPDIYKRQTIAETYKRYEETLPSPTNKENWGLVRPHGHIQRDEGVGTDPQEYYDKYWPILKDMKWGDFDLPEVYMVLTLVKTGNYDEIPKMKAYWSTDNMGRVIRAAFDMWGEGHTQYTKDDKWLKQSNKYMPKKENPDRETTKVTNIHPDFKLTEEERIKLFETLMQQIPVKPTSRTKDEDYPMIRHRTFSLLYYLYDWGFNQYMNIVKNLKNNWSVYNITDEGKTMRMGEFGHIFSYLSRDKKWDEMKKIMDEVFSWDMDEKEKYRTRQYLQMMPSWLHGFKNREEFEKEVLPRYNVEPYKSSGNDW